jgi:hypothetical protein
MEKKMMFVILTKESENHAEVRYKLETTIAGNKSFTDADSHTRDFGKEVSGRGVFHKESNKFTLESPTDGFFLGADAQSALKAIEAELSAIAEAHKQFPSFLTVRG